MKEKLIIYSNIFNSHVDYQVEIDYPETNHMILTIELDAFLKLVHSKLKHPVKKWTKTQQDYDFEMAIKEALLEIKGSTIYA